MGLHICSKLYSTVLRVFKSIISHDFLGEYFGDIPQTGGKKFIHITTNRIISMIIRSGTLLNGRVLHMDLTNSLITLICRCIHGTCSAVTVVLMVDLPGIISLIFSNPLPI